MQESKQWIGRANEQQETDTERTQQQGSSSHSNSSDIVFFQLQAPTPAPSPTQADFIRQCSKCSQSDCICRSRVLDSSAVRVVLLSTAFAPYVLSRVRA